MRHPLVLALTGASGAVYGLRLLEALLAQGQEVHLLASPAARKVVRTELGPPLEGPDDLPRVFEASHQVMQLGGEPEISDADSIASLVSWQGHQDYMAAIASGSFRTAGMVICPCSMDTLASVSHGLASNLVHRAAAVHLKERRRLILVPRETPLGTIALANMTRLAEAGATILPAMPGFYQQPHSIADLVDFVVARICDQLGLDHELSSRWGNC